MMVKNLNRRKFIGISMAVAAGLGGAGLWRILGRTGFQVGLFSLGGEATVQIRERRDKAVEIIHRALDLGVNYIDTAPT